MGTLAQIRAGIASNLSTLDLEVYGHEPKRVNGQAAIVSFPDTYDPHPVYGTSTTLTIPVRFEVPWGSDDESADEALEQWMNAAVTALESDPTLSGACDDSVCRPFTNIGASRRGDDTVVLQFVVPVEVFA